jgi:hypothetical protein
MIYITIAVLLFFAALFTAGKLNHKFQIYATSDRNSLIAGTLFVSLIWPVSLVALLLWGLSWLVFAVGRYILNLGEKK